MSSTLPPVVRKLAKQPDLLQQFRDLDALMSAGNADPVKAQKRFAEIRSSAAQRVGVAPEPAQFAQAQLLESARVISSGLGDLKPRKRVHP